MTTETDPTLTSDDALALDAFREAARGVEPSPFHTARALRSLESAIDADRRARAPWTPRRVVGVALGAAFAGAAAVALVMRPAAPVVAVATPAVQSAPAPMAPTSPVTPATVLVAPAPVAPVVAVAAHKPTVVAQPSPAPRARSWRDEAAADVDAGDAVAAARVIVAALATDDGAAASLSLLARRFPEALDAVDDELALQKNAEAMRLRCEQKLLRQRDRGAVEACRAFGLEHPENPAARTLAYAAGRLAEDEVNDLALAEEAYSRALLLSPFAGLPGTDALLARARVRAARGNVDEARADLRLYLANEPASRQDPVVAAFAQRLGL